MGVHVTSTLPRSCEGADPDVGCDRNPQLAEPTGKILYRNVSLSLIGMGAAVIHRPSAQ